MNEFETKTITELASKYDLSLRTLRFYEERGLLNPLRLNLLRVYSRRDEIKLQIILRAKRLGFSITEIGKLIADHEKSGTMEGPDSLRMEPSLIEERIDALNKHRQSLSQAIDELNAALVQNSGPKDSHAGSGNGK